MLRRHVMAAALLAATVLATPTASAAPCVWTPTTLTLPSGVPGGVVRAADSAGGFAGTGYVPNPWGGGRTNRVLRWSGDTLTDLGRLEGYGNPTVTGVDQAGTVVGYAGFTESQAFRSRDGKLEALPNPPGAKGSQATGINDNGDIVGHGISEYREGNTVWPVYTPVLWPAAAPGTVVKLTGLPGTGHAKANGIDQDGTVLVEYYPKLTEPYATALYLWKAGTARKLRLPTGTAYVTGNAISNGRVAGDTRPSRYAQSSGALWERDGTVVRPAQSWWLTSVNRSGQSVGTTTDRPAAEAVWRLGTLDARFTGQVGVYVSADDGSVAGLSAPAPAQHHQPTVWRCG